MAVRRGGNPRVSITGDASGVSNATKDAERSLDRLGKSGSKSLSGLKTAALATGAALAGGVVLGLKASAHAAIEAETANARLKAQLEALGISYSAHEKQIQRVIDKHSQLSGLDDEDLGDSFTNIVRVVGDVDKALKLNVIAMDFARAKHIEVAKAGELVGKVAGGNVGILSRYGIAIDKNATSSQALALLQQKFAGQAEKYGKTTAGSADRASVAFENLGESIGSKVTPLIARGADALNTLIRQMTLGEGPGGRIREVFEGIGSAAGTAFTGIRGLVTGFQDGESSARLLTASLGGLTAGFVAFRVVSTAVAAVTALRAAWIGLTAAIAANPIGALALGVTALVAALGILSIKTRDNTVTSRAFTDALHDQRDALREVEGISVDMAQRHANLRSATVAVEQAEKRLKDLRKDGNAKALDLKQAEADLQQARVGQRRATADLARAEDDNKDKRDRLRDATRKLTDEEHKHNGQINSLIVDRKKEITSIDGSIDAVKQQGGNYKVMQGTVDKLRGRQAALRKEIDRLESKKVSVSVDFTLHPAPQSAGPNGQVRPGDGVGKSVDGSVQRLAQTAADSGRLLPTNFGGDLKGARPAMAPFAAIGSMFGLGVSSGLRPGAITSSGNRSWHGTGEAIDMADGRGPDAAKLGFFNFMKNTFGGSLAELIYTPGGSGIKNGRPFTYSGQVAEDHFDHVHVAYDSGAPGLGDGPGKGDGIGQAVDAAYKAGFRGSALVRMVAIAGRESSYHTDAQNLKYPDHSIGLWQINQLAHHGRYGTDAQLKNAYTNARAAWAISGHGHNFSPWSTNRGLSQAYLSRASTAVTAYLKGGKKPSSAKPGKKMQTYVGGFVNDYVPPTLISPGDPGGAGDSGSDAPDTSMADAIRELAAEMARTREQNKWLIEQQGPALIGAVLAEVNGGIGGRVGLGFSGIRSPAGSVAGL